MGIDPVAAFGRNGKGRARCGKLIVQVSLPDVDPKDARTLSAMAGAGQC